MAAVSGKSAKIRITSAAATSSTNEPCTRSTGAGTANGFVQVTSTSRRHLDRSDTPALYRIAAGSTTLVSAASYVVDPVRGRFNYVTGDPATGLYQADIAWHSVSFLAQANSWGLDTSVDMLDVTAFSTSTGDARWRTIIAGLSGAEATLGRFWSSGTTAPAFMDRITTEDDLVVELITDELNRFEAYARISGDSVSASVGDPTREEVSLQIDGPLYFTT